MIDLSPYFELIGYRHQCKPDIAALQSLHLRHTHTILFEMQEKFRIAAERILGLRSRLEQIMEEHQQSGQQRNLAMPSVDDGSYSPVSC